MRQPRIPIDRQRLADFCRKHHIRKLSLFGSVLRDDFRPDSDVDVIADFKTGHEVGFFKLYDIEQELSEILGGRKIDLCLGEECLNRWIRDEVLAEALVEYAEG